MKNIKIIIPVLLLVFIGFFFINTQANNKNQQQESAEVSNNHSVKITIDKNTKEEDFGQIIEMLKKQDVNAEFNDIQRNEDGLITSISVRVSNQFTSASFANSSNLGISPIEINIADNQISVGGSAADGFDDFFGFSNQNQDPIQQMMQNQQKIFQQFGNEDPFSAFYQNMFGNANPDSIANQMMNSFQFFNNGNSFNFSFDDEDPFFKYEKGEDKDADEFYFNLDKDAKVESKTETIYKVNGKEMTKEEYENFDKDKIYSLEIYEKRIIKSVR